MANIKRKPKTQTKRSYVKVKHFSRRRDYDELTISVSKETFSCLGYVGHKKRSLKPTHYPANDPIETKKK